MYRSHCETLEFTGLQCVELAAQQDQGLSPFLYEVSTHWTDRTSSLSHVRVQNKLRAWNGWAVFIVTCLCPNKCCERGDVAAR